MGELTLEQKRAVAVARARMRMRQGKQDEPAPKREAAPEPFVPSGEKTSGWLGGIFGYDPKALGITPAENIAAHPVTRFAMGAAAPIMGAAQLGAEALGDKSGTETLRRVEELKDTGMKAMGGEGFDAAGMAGTVVSPLALAVMKYLKPASTVLGRTGQGAGVGAGFGASTPVTEGDNFLASKAAQTATGAAIGGAIPPAIDLTKTAYRFGRNVLDPILPGGADRTASRMLAEAVAARRAEVERLLRENKQFVPGSQATAAEVASPAGATELSGMQNLLSKKFPTRFRDIDISQEGARRAAIGGFAGDKSSLASAVAKRAANARNTYGPIADDVVRISPSDAPLFQRPAMEKAFARARQLTEEQGREWGGTVQDFQNLKMALDDMVKDPATFGIGASEANAISKTRSAFIDWFNKASPKWEAARTAYAADSAPINRMQVAQELEKSLTSPLGTTERPAAFAGAVQNAPRTIKRATGSPRFDEIEQIDPKLGATARNVLDDLNRQSTSEQMGRLGQNRAAEITGPSGLPATGPLHQEYMIFKTILGRIAKGTNEKSMESLARALETPQAALELLRKAPTQQQQAIIDSLVAQKFGRAATIGMTTSLAGQEQF